MAQVYATHRLQQSDASPSVELITSWANTFCADEFEAFIGLPVEESRLRRYAIHPDASGWIDGDRVVVCIVGSQWQVTESLRGVNR